MLKQGSVKRMRFLFSSNFFKRVGTNDVDKSAWAKWGAWMFCNKRITKNRQLYNLCAYSFATIVEYIYSPPADLLVHTRNSTHAGSTYLFCILPLPLPRRIIHYYPFTLSIWYLSNNQAACQLTLCIAVSLLQWYCKPLFRDLDSENKYSFYLPVKEIYKYQEIYFWDSFFIFQPVI